jgi:hypothetical protein
MRIGENLDIELQPRDIALLCGLFESRVMTLKHVSALYFDGKGEMAKKRVQKLKAAKLIRERPRHSVSDPSVLFLTRAAFELLSKSACFAAYPQISPFAFDKRATVSNLTIRHELEVMDVKTAMIAAIAKFENLRVAEYSTWPALYQFKAFRSSGEQVIVKPDGFMRVHETEADGGSSEHTFFLELDRSTESLDILCQRAYRYSDYYRSGGYAIRCGGSSKDYKQFPFRVIWVCKTAQRKQNLMERLRTSTPPILTQALVGITDDAVSDPLGTCWHTPGNTIHAAYLFAVHH